MMMNRTSVYAGIAALTLLAPALLCAQGAASSASVPVTIDTFVRAEADTYFEKRARKPAVSASSITPELLCRLTATNRASFG